MIFFGVLQGFPSKDMTKLEDYGFVASRPRGEYHANNQQMAKLLHKAIGLGGKKAAPMVGPAPPPPFTLLYLHVVRWDLVFAVMKSHSAI